MYAPRLRGASLGEQVPHLFISYSSQDKQWVSQLAEDLNLCGVDVWFDAWELRVGDDLHERIGDAVDKSRFVAVVVTKHFNESKWIRGEVHQALSREKAGNRFRSATCRRSQWNSDDGSRRCASTFTAW